MRIVYMGKDKPSTVAGLKYLVQKGIEVPVVVAPLREQSVFGGPTLADTAHAFGIPTATDEELYYCLRASNGVAERGYALHDVDLVVSFLFWKKIRRPLIDLPRIGCINLHPAPLPDFRGLGGYNFAIYEGAPSWGVSAHFVDESFDTGDIIKVRTFDNDPSEETAYSLEQKSQTIPGRGALHNQTGFRAAEADPARRYGGTDREKNPSVLVSSLRWRVY
jgi:methionyl-tRNA formyltransferase